MLVILILTTLLLVLAVQLILRAWKRRNLPPGPVRWPILGNLVEMTLADAKYPHKALAKMAEKYGDIMSFGFGVHDAGNANCDNYTVVVSSHEAMKDLFTREELCTSRYEFPYVLDRAFHKNLGILWGSGLVWQEMRRFTFKVLKDVGFGKKKSMETPFQDEMNDMVEFLKSETERNNGNFLIDHETLASNAINILWSFVGGFRFPTGDDKLAKMIKSNELAVEIYGHKNIYSAFPFLKNWFPNLSQHDHHMKMHKDTQEFFQEIIEDVKQKGTSNLDQNPDNFIEVFLEEIEKNAGNPQSMFTSEQLNVLLSDLYLGGSETISTTLQWAILYLTMNPEVQRKVQMEIKNTLGDQPISVKDAARLPYLKAIIYEVLRMGNVLPVPIPRKATADMHYKVLNDKQYWKDPQVFRPDRFLTASEEKVINTERVAVFGFGKRSCPGENFAMDSLFIFLSTLLQKFSFEAPDGESISDDNPNTGLTITPRPYNVKVVIN